MDNIYAIIILYHPDKKNLKRLIDKINDHVECIVIGNNSASIDTIDFSHNKRIKLFNMDSNVGIGKAQNICIEWAFLNGADYIINFDQDSIPEIDLIKKLGEAYDYLITNKYEVGILGPEYKDSKTNQIAVAKKYNEKKIKDKNYFLVPQIINSGSIMPRSTYEKVGLYDENLFIDYVDFDYCWKCLQSNLSIFLIKNIFIFHNLGEGSNKLLDKLNMHKISPYRHYYTFRNTIYLLNKKHVPKKWILRNLIKQIMYFFIYPILNGQIRLRYKFMLLGIKDGIEKKYGRYEK